MKINNIKLVIRDIRRNKLYSFIKIGGFALGIAACFLIALFVRYELSYDKHFKNGENIYRVVQVQNMNGEVIPSTVLQAPLAETIKNEFPEVENTCKIIYFGAGKNRIRRSDNTNYFNETGFVFAEQSFMDVFQLPVLKGDSREGLTGANKVVISKRVADKFFPDEEALGKAFILNNDDENPYTITAIIDNFPANSHMKFDFLVSLNLNDDAQQNWNFSSFHNYVLLKPGTNVSDLEEKMKTIVTRYIIPYDEEQNQFFYDRKNDYYELQAVKDIHLKSAHIFQNESFDYADVGDIRVVWALGISALFILLLACINFINLSTAKSTNRAKEIGLKKTIGAQRGTLIRQFFVESILYSIFSIIVATGLTVLLLPTLNQLSGKTFTIPWNEWWLIPFLVSVAVFIGSLAGIYPSIYLTSFNTVKILKGNISENKKNTGLRNGMVVFQFAASIVLIICTMAIFKQMNYILNKDLGFSKEQVIVLQGGNIPDNEISPFKQELNSIAEVQSVSVSSYLPIENSMRNGNTFTKVGRQGIDPGIISQNWVIDNGYIETMGLKIVEGRNFLDDLNSEQNVAIINQEMVKQLGLENPIGERISGGGDTLSVVGVVADFHFNKMQYQIIPLVMRNGLSNNFISVKVRSSDMAGTISIISELWNKVSPNQDFRYSFLDAEYAAMYDNVQRMGILFRSFALLAIIVACLGLFGLAEFITKQRTKEIGVRKVNGAKVAGILSMLNKDFIKWVSIAFVIATPIAYYAMHKWLENFAYKTTLSWWIFALAGVLALGIALLSVSWQSWRAATRNPVEALRYE